MSKYRKIDVRIWNDAKFSTMSDRGKLAFLFVLTHPHMTSIGAMRATVAGMAAELGWLPEVFREAFSEALSKALVRHDDKAAFVWLPNFLKYNAPESPNVVASWGKSLELVPECELQGDLINHVREFSETLSDKFKLALPEAFRKASVKPKRSLRQDLPKDFRYQEQEQDIKKAHSAPVAHEIVASLETVETPKALPPVGSIEERRAEMLRTIERGKAFMERDDKATTFEEWVATKWQGGGNAKPTA